MREFESQRPAKSYTALQMVHHRLNIYRGVLPWRYDAVMGTANSLHTLAYNTASIMEGLVRIVVL